MIALLIAVVGFALGQLFQPMPKDFDAFQAGFEEGRLYERKQRH